MRVGGRGVAGVDRDPRALPRSILFFDPAALPLLSSSPSLFLSVRRRPRCRPLGALSPYAASSLLESAPQSCLHPSSSPSLSRRPHIPSSIPGVLLTLLVFHLQPLCHAQ